MSKIITCEQVSNGHPDKICDQIADAIVTDILQHDRNARVAIECLLKKSQLFIAGEVTTDYRPNYNQIVHDVFNRIGAEKLGWNLTELLRIGILVDKQSPDIAMGVNDAIETRGGESTETGAGDQGMMFGYACDETPELMPLAISLSHKLCKKLAELRKNKTLTYLRPDGKAQVTVEYDGDKPVRVDTVVISTQHAADVSLETIRRDMMHYVIPAVIPAELLDENTKYFINPTGRFVVGGPQGDSGLTGRKIIVDTYGGTARHGGGAFSGKDPTKVDRSGAYAARYIAKNIVAAGLAKRCEVQLAYAIGVAHPVSVLVDTFGTGTVSEEALSKAVLDVFQLTPDGIIRMLDLRKPQYRKLAAYGHMGREDLGVAWERKDKVDALKAAVAKFQ